MNEKIIQDLGKALLELSATLQLIFSRAGLRGGFNETPFPPKKNCGQINVPWIEHYCSRTVD
jgi:hypothetical protein